MAETTGLHGIFRCVYWILAPVELAHRRLWDYMAFLNAYTGMAFFYVYTGFERLLVLWTTGLHEFLKRLW